MNLPRLVRSAQTSIAGAREYWRGWPVENTVLPQVFLYLHFPFFLCPIYFLFLLFCSASLSSFYCFSLEHCVCRVSPLFRVIAVVRPRFTAGPSPHSGKVLAKSTFPLPLLQKTSQKSQVSLPSSRVISKMVLLPHGRQVRVQSVQSPNVLAWNRWARSSPCRQPSYKTEILVICKVCVTKARNETQKEKVHYNEIAWLK